LKEVLSFIAVARIQEKLVSKCRIFCAGYQQRIAIINKKKIKFEEWEQIKSFNK